LTKKIKKQNPRRFLTLTHCINKKPPQGWFLLFGGAGGIAQLSRYIRENFGLKARFAGSASKQSVIAKRIKKHNPRRFLTLTHCTNKKTTARVVFVVWWSRRESNPRPQALHRQFYILSCVV
jgi:hypothetical protein